MEGNVTSIIEENERRNRKRKTEANFNPITGLNCNSIPRDRVYISDYALPEFYAPTEMFRNDIFTEIVRIGSIRDYLISIDEYPTSDSIEKISNFIEKLRIKTDFEYTAASFFEIKNKKGGGNVQFFLNPMQKELLRKFEEQRRAKIPIRIILLKFKQGGGSTFVQLYFAWIQLFLHENWNSIICAHVENAARIIRGMYSKVLAKFPASLIGSKDDFVKLVPYEGARNTVEIKNRGCRITVGSAEKPESTRAEDAALIHCSELGFWKTTAGKSPEELVAALCSGVPDIPDTVIVYESTAKGINFFSREWARATASNTDGNKSVFTPIFVPWFLSERNDMSLEAYYKEKGHKRYDLHRRFIATLTDYEKDVLWELGATLEQIAWYRIKAATFPNEWIMKQENPSNAEEAFQTSGRRKFNQSLVIKLKSNCTPPKKIGNIVGDGIRGKQCLENVKFIEEEQTQSILNKLLVWKLPDGQQVTRRYVVSVDIGGVSDKADFSVITVFDRYWMMELGGVPEKVARWKGHISHGQLAWIATQIATFYDNALLIFESNTLETDKTEGDHLEYILNEIAGAYRNLYCRNSAEVIRDKVPAKWGFHTNVSTKTMVMDNLETMLNTNGYIEHDAETCEEMSTYEIKDNGSLGAVDGFHDDNLMSTGIGVFVCLDLRYYPLPTIVTQNTGSSKKIVSAASF